MFFQAVAWFGISRISSERAGEVLVGGSVSSRTSNLALGISQFPVLCLLFVFNGVFLFQCGILFVISCQ